MRRTNQGGSVLGFIIGAVALALLLVGGVYFVHLQSTFASQDAPQKPQEAPTKPTPEPEKQPGPSTEVQLPSQLPSSNEGEAHQMPQTGPRETILSMIALALVSGLAVSYVRSRRLLASL